MTIPRDLICSSHTISGVLPGSPLPARHSFEDRVSACAEAGYTGMCLHFRDYRALQEAGYSQDRLASIIRDAAIRDVTLEFLTDWFLTGMDGEESRRDEATLLEAAEVFGAHGFNVGADFHGRGLPLQSMRDRFMALCNRAAAQNLTVALEIVPWSNVPDIDTALFMIDDIANAGLVIDSWHIFRGGIPLSDLRHIPAGRILSIQVDDAASTITSTLAEDTMRRLPCGEGIFQLDDFLQALNQAGASVPVSVEIISPDFAALPVREAAHRSIAGARALVERLRSTYPAAG